MTKRGPLATILADVISSRPNLPSTGTSRNLILGVLPALLAVLIGACAPSEPVPTPTPTATVVPTPTIVPTPTLSAQFSELTILEVGSVGREVLGYVENTGPHPVSELLIQLAMFDEQGELLDGALFSPLYPELGPGEKSPFRVQFPPGDQAHETLVEVVSYGPLSIAPARPSIEILERTESSAGHVTLVGQLNSDAPYRLEAVVGISSRADGTPSAWLSADEFAVISTPDQPALFSLIVPAAHLNDDLALYPVGAAVSEVPRTELEFSIEPTVLLSAQGDPFVFGEVQNPTEASAQGRILLTFRRDNQLIEFHAVPIPMPLRAGGTLAFSVADLPVIDGLVPQDPSALAGISLDYRLEGVLGAENRRAARLGSEILEFEVIGSTAFLRARIENTHSEPVNQPTVFAALRSTSGTLQTAAWASPGGRIDPGQRLEALIQIPLPEGVNVFRGEFDIWAAGWSSEQ